MDRHDLYKFYQNTVVLGQFVKIGFLGSGLFIRYILQFFAMESISKSMFSHQKYERAKDFILTTPKCVA